VSESPTPYTSIPDLVTDVAPFLPAGRLIADHFDTLAEAPFIGASTVIIHGGGHHGDLLVRARATIVDAIAGTTATTKSEVHRRSVSQPASP
jgi:hypothetical protein